MTALSWLTNGFITRDLYGPFCVDNDNEYYDDLNKRYRILIDSMNRAGADSMSISVAKRFADSVKKSVREYYQGRIINSQIIVEDLVSECLKENLAYETLHNCEAFGRIKSEEIQFFRGREISDEHTPVLSEMMHLPKRLRYKARSDRYSLAGVPGLYLSNSSYGCWIELKRPCSRNYYVSPVLLDSHNIKVFNLAVMNRDFHALRDGNETTVLNWIKLLILMIATSYKVKNNDNSNGSIQDFHSEYIISQNIILACRKLDYDGVVYYSCRVEDHMFAQPAINVALFVDYRPYCASYSEISKHVKIGQPVNYQFYNMLNAYERECEYDLQCLRSHMVNVVGNYNHYFKYKDIEFCSFDKYLFSHWEDKDRIKYGMVNNTKS